MSLEYILIYIILAVIFIGILILGLKSLAKYLPFNSYEWYMAKTYFYSNKNKGFISLISTISILGMVLGSASVIIAASFMNGMEKEVRSRVIASDSHIKIRGYLGRFLDEDTVLLDYLKQNEAIKGASNKVLNYALIGVGQGSKANPVIVNGVDMRFLSSVSDVQTRIISGSFNIGKFKVYNERLKKDQEYYGIVLGKYLADNLNLSGLDIGRLITIAAIPDKIDFRSTYSLRNFYFAGIVDLGFPQYDQTFAYVDLKVAQDIFQMDGKISYIDIKLFDEAKTDEVSIELDQKLSHPMVTKTWMEDWVSQFSLMEFEKQMYLICLGLIIALAAFNIMSTLYMMVKDKTKDIGVLRSLGVKTRSIMMIFVNQGILIGILGAFGGFILSMITLYLQSTFKLIRFPQNTLIIDYLPVDIHFAEVVYVLLFTIVIASISGIYPAYKASKLQPVDALRYE